MSNLWILPSEMGDQEDSEYAAEAAQTASYLLWAMSGRKYSGVTLVTERYVRATATTPLGGEVTNVAAASGHWDEPIKRLRLRGRPVSAVHTIRLVDGTVVSPADYYLVDHSTVEFTNPAFWDLADIEITYAYGSPPPLAGKMAARVLARELTKSWSGADDCALPARVTSVTRQGVSYTFLDSQDFLAELRTGVYEVDLFLKTTNPDKARARSRVFSPDIARGRRYTPKSLELPVSSRDVSVKAETTFALTLPLTSVGGDFLAIESGWTLETVLHSYAGARVLTLEPAYSYVEGVNIVVAFPYSAVVSVLKLTDPGTWDLYATKDHASTHLASGNLRIDLTK